MVDPEEIAKQVEVPESIEDSEDSAGEAIKGIQETLGVANEGDKKEGKEEGKDAGKSSSDKDTKEGKSDQVAHEIVILVRNEKDSKNEVETYKATMQQSGSQMPSKTETLTKTINADEDMDKVIQEALQVKENEYGTEKVEGEDKKEDSAGEKSDEKSEDKGKPSVSKFSGSKKMNREYINAEKDTFWTMVDTDKGLEKVLIKVKTLTIIESTSKIEAKSMAESQRSGIYGIFGAEPEKHTTGKSKTFSESVTETRKQSQRKKTKKMTTQKPRNRTKTLQNRFQNQSHP